MPPTQRHRSSPYIACAAVALIGGLSGGATAVHGLRLNSYGNMPPAKVEAVVADDRAYAIADETLYGDCSECSDRALGFRWASERNIMSPADCPNDSWHFRRGCVAYAMGSAY